MLGVGRATELVVSSSFVGQWFLRVVILDLPCARVPGRVWTGAGDSDVRSAPS